MIALKENEHIDKKGCEFFFGCIGYFNHYAFFTDKLWKKVEGFQDEDEAEVKCAFLSLWAYNSLKRATIWFMSRLKQLPIQQSKLEVCEGLEEEINRLSKNEYFDFTDWKAIARHFAKWQKEQMMKDCVHEVNQAYFRGIEVGKAEMMKEAVEGEVYLYHSYNRNATAIVVDIPKENLGDKVRIIICKKED